MLTHVLKTISLTIIRLIFSKLKTEVTESKLWERQIIEIFCPNKTQRNNLVIGNIYRPPYNSRDSLATFMMEFNSTPLENRTNSQKVYMCGDYNVDLSKLNRKKTPWVTNGILRSINTRNKLYKKLKKTKIDSPNYIANKTNFNKYRNTLNKTITNDKRVYYKEIFNLYKDDIKKIWGVISETLNRKAKKSVSETMTVNGQDCSNKEIIMKNSMIFLLPLEKRLNKYSQT